MTFLEIAKRRFSVRNFKNKQIPEPLLKQVIEAARIAPSAANRQPWKFIIIQSEETRKLLYLCYKRDWIKEAPAIIVACGDHTQGWIRKQDNKDHTDIDVAIAIDHLTLEASSLGLGTCWVCAFDAKKCADLLDLPNYLEPIALIPIGYPNDEPVTNRFNTLRKSLDEIVYWEDIKR